MLVSIGQQVGQAIANSQLFSEVKEKAQNWEASYTALREANAQLTRRAETLERQIQELHHAEQQIWVALAASQRARRSSPVKQTSNAEGDEQLVATLKRILAAMNKQRKEKREILSQIA